MISQQNIVRETLTADLIERLIIDILEVTENLKSKSLFKKIKLNSLSHRPFIFKSYRRQSLVDFKPC